jgi:membrane protease YdiL (CAAX protease family)
MSEPGVIESPPRAGRWASAATLLLLFALAASGPLGAPTLLVGLALTALALAAGLRDRSAVTVHLAVIVLLIGVLHHLLGKLWPLPTVLTLAAYGAALVASARVRAGAGWLRRGRLTRGSAAIMVVFIASEAIALVIWRHTTSADLSHFATLVPDVPGWLLPVGLVGFALINGAYEELLWRGVIQHALHSATGCRWHAWWLQGLGFGLWHFQGFPSGWVGSGLAAVFALMMGYLRLRSAGMLAPYVAHVGADITIFSMVAIMVRG